MATTTYYGIPLPADGAQDWVPVLNRVLSMITESMRRNQKPSAVTLLWGDVTGGKYLEAGERVRVFGGLDTTLQPTRNFVLDGGASFPADLAENMLFVKDGVAYLRSGGAWVALGQTSGEAVGAAGGVLVSAYGGVLGTYLVSDGADGLLPLAPGEAGGFYVSDPESEVGWAFKTPDAVVASVMSQKGDLVTVDDDGDAYVLPVGADGTLPVADSAQDGGIAWKTFSSRLALSFGAKGELLAGTGSGAYAAVPAAASNNRLPLSDATQPTGIRWVQQSELGAIPGTRTRVGADLYLHTNYL